MTASVKLFPQDLEHTDSDVILLVCIVQIIDLTTLFLQEFLLVYI